MNGIAQIAEPSNERVLNYAPGSPERENLKKRLDQMLAEEYDIPAIIGGKEIRSGNTRAVKIMLLPQWKPHMRRGGNGR